MILEIIKGRKSIIDAAREYDLKQSDPQKGLETLSEYARQGLLDNPRNVQPMREDQPRARREKIGELVLQIDVFKNAMKVLKDFEEKTSFSE